MDTAQIVRVENVGDTEWSDQFDSVTYTIPAGESRHIPLGACAVWLGNPDDHTTERRHIVDRIQLRYSYGSMSTESWDDVRPKLEVFDQATGDRIWFPADDPEGKNGTYVRRPSAVITDTRDDVEGLRRQLNEMHDLLVAAGVTETPAQRTPAPASDKAIREDKPTKPSVSA